MSAAPLAARDAALTILDHVSRQPPLRVPLDDALDSVLAQDVASPIDLPAWTNSAMDGYAVRAADIRGARRDAPVRLRVVETIPAGHFPTRPIGAGEAARIFTGAPLPEEADTVVRQEDTDEGAEVVSLFDDRDAGVNIRLVGEDLRRGDLVLRDGTALGPAELGVLASMAVAHPLVYRRPRVAILGGGDEIVDIDQPEEILSGRKVASSNSHTLVALVRRAGGSPSTSASRETRRKASGRISRGASTATSSSRPPASAWASTTISAPSSPQWAWNRNSGSCGCALVRRSASGSSAGSRGSACRAIR